MLHGCILPAAAHVDCDPADQPVTLQIDLQELKAAGLGVLDTNNDGVLDASELDLIDTDHDGKISQAELDALVASQDAADELAVHEELAQATENARDPVATVFQRTRRLERILPGVALCGGQRRSHHRLSRPYGDDRSRS